MIFKKTVLGMALTVLVCTYANAYDIKLLSEIPQKGKISAIGLNTVTDTAAVVSAAGQSLSIVDMRSFAVMHVIPLPAAPSGLAVHQGMNRAAVSTVDGSLLLYDLKSGEMTDTIAVGTAVYSVAIDESKKIAFLGVDGGVRMVDLTTRAVLSTMDFPGKTLQLILGKSQVAVVSRDENGSMMRLIAPMTGNTVANITLSGEVMSVGMDEQLGYILVTLVDTPGIFVYDAATLKPLAGIQIKNQVQIISVNPSTHTAALADTLDGSLTIVDFARKTILDSIPLYGQMGPLYLDTTRNRVLVAHDQSLMVVQLENPIPRINKLVPRELKAGEEGFPLTIVGEKFLKESQTRFGTAQLRSSFDNNELIRTDILAEHLLVPGDVPVSVTNPPPGGGISNELKFRILTPPPILSAISPSLVENGGSSFTLRVKGNSFLPSATVSIDGKKTDTNFISSTLLESTVDAALIATIGKFPITVTNSGTISFTSNSIPLTVASVEEIAQAVKKTVLESKPANLTGSLTGRILNTEMQPLRGVTIKVNELSTVTDDDGHFTLNNVPAGKRTVLIDGSTAAEVGGHYPTIPISVDIHAGLLNPMPFTPYFHRQKSHHYTNIDIKKETVLTDPAVHGFEMRIPKGVRIIGWDGKANVKVSVRTVPADRLPVKPLPRNAHVRTVYMFHFDKVGGGKPDRPIPVTAPNDLGLLPGEKAVLWYYDESQYEGEAPNDWAIAGTGTVTRDGKSIVSDPGVGIPKFCCGATAFGGSGAGSGGSGPGGGPGDQGSGGGGDGISPESCDQNSISGNAGDPVNLATGYFIYDKSDYKINGAIPFEIKRFYRSGDDGMGAFGKGTYFGFDWWIGDYSDMLLLLKPGNYQYRFFRQTDGTYINTTDPEYQGDVFYRNADNTLSLKKKNGWNFTFGTDRLLNLIKDLNGNALTFLKEIDGNISTIILPDGRRINISYNIGGINGRDCITSITGPSGTVNYTYNGGKLQSVQYPDGSSVSYGYDASGRMNAVIENGKLVVANVYDADNRVATQSRPDGAVNTFSYTLAGGNITETGMTTPNGALTKWRFYDDSGAYRNGYVTNITTPDGETIYERESGNNLVKSVTDPLGRVTLYTYDAKGRTLTKTDPVGNTTGYQYEDACSNVTQITDPLGKSTTFVYTFASGTCRKTRTEIRDPLLNLTVIEYDGYGMPTRVTDANSNPTSFTYDPTHPEQLSSAADPLGNTVRYGYDTMGRLTSFTDAKGAKTTYGYDSVSERVTSVTDPIGKTTYYAYDTAHNLRKVTDAKGNTIQYEYDDRNRVTKMTDQLGRFETYAYYRNTEITPTTGDNLKMYTDRKGQATNFNQYDPMNRLKLMTFNDGSYLQYTYDAAGRATSIYDSISGAIGYTYNDHGCSSCGGRGLDLISEEQTSLSTIDYTYDATGRRTSMTVAGEPVVNYTYDDAGRLTGISRNVGGISRTYALGYDNAGRRTSVQIPLANGGDFVTTVYGYDIANRITSMLLQGPTAQIENLTYTYDPNGNRLSFMRNVPQTVSPATSNTNYNAANEMLAFNDKILAYDQNGNLLTRTDVCGTPRVRIVVASIAL